MCRTVRTLLEADAKFMPVRRKLTAHGADDLGHPVFSVVRHTEDFVYPEEREAPGLSLLFGFLIGLRGSSAHLGAPISVMYINLDIN